jgi:hypothetical protein
MKSAAILSLFLTIVLGIYAIGDYYHNVQSLRQHANVGPAELLNGHLLSPEEAEKKRYEDQEGTDGVIGIVAFVALIGSLILFAQAKKDNKEKMRNPGGHE